MLAEQLHAALQATAVEALGKTGDGGDHDAEKEGVKGGSRAVVVDRLAEMDIDDALWLSVIEHGPERGAVPL